MSTAGLDVSTAFPAVQSNLEALYRKIHEDSPNARIFALGYPNPLPKSFVPGTCPALEKGPVGFGVDAADVLALHNLIVTLDTTVRNAAHDVEFVQYVEPWSGHDLCAGNGSWFFPLDAGGPLPLYPNEQGQKELALDLRGYAGPVP